MIYTRIDTFSVILYSASIRNTLSYFNVSTEFLDELFPKGYKSNSVQTGDTFVWSVKGIRFECKLRDYLDACDRVTDISIFDFVFPWIRFYISGDGISYIEECSKDITDFSLQINLSNPEFYSYFCSNFKITRVDFAFDYINYEGKEFDRLRKILSSAEFDSNLSKNGRLFTGSPSGISYSIRSGKERTIYLGTTSADRMLRIYDKKYQVFDENGIADLSKIPKVILDEEGTINSWHRIELQCRDDFAFSYLFSSAGDFRYVMGEIANFFDVRTADGKLLAPLHKIFLWVKRTPIIQNAKSVQPLTELEAAKVYVQHIALRKVSLLYGILGSDGFVYFINNCIKQRASSRKEVKDRYLNRFNTDLGVLLKQENLSLDDTYFIQDEDGVFYLEC